MIVSLMTLEEEYNKDRANVVTYKEDNHTIHETDKDDIESVVDHGRRVVLVNALVVPSHLKVRSSSGKWSPQIRQWPRQRL